MRAEESSDNRLRQYFGVAIILISLASLVFMLFSSLKAFGAISDFSEYYAPARLCLKGAGASSYVINLLGQEQHRIFPSMAERVVLLFVPPPALMLLVPMGLLNPLASEIIWKLILVSSLMGTVFILAKMLSLRKHEVCYLAAAICLSQACYEVLRIDQLAPILLLAFTAAIYYLQKKQDIKAGLLLSLFVLKPQLVLAFLAYIAGLRRWRPLLIMTIIIGALSVLAYFVIGNSGYKNYFDLLRLPNIAQFMQPELMPTVRGQLLKILPDDAANIMKIAILIYGIVIGLAFSLGNKYKGTENSILRGVLLIMPLALITSLHCHSYDLLLLVPTVALIFSDKVLRFSPYFKLIVILAGIVFVLPLSTMIHYNYLLRGGKFNIWFVELLILSALILKQGMMQKPTPETVILKE